MSAPLTPRIETPRLILRGHTADDFRHSFALWSNPEVVRFITGRPATEEECWGRLHRYIGHWAVVGFGYWVVEEKVTGQFVGEVGFADFKRDITPSFDGAPEAGWALMPSVHGRGYATEALQTATSWLEAKLGRVRTVCIIDATNAPSLRVAEKMGYRPWTQGTYKGSAAPLFERLPDR